MNVNVEISQLNGRVLAVPSKSYAHRILMCSALCRGETTVVDGLYRSDDVSATVSALSTLGASVTNNLVVAPKVYSDGLMDVGESGSTYRFMLPISSALGGEYVFVTRGRLSERPNTELINALSEHGIEFSGAKYLKSSGYLKGGRFVIRGDVSSQYISGLLMALPILEEDSEIILTTPLSSKNYVDITISVMKSFGIKVEKFLNIYKIKGGQKYLSPKIVKVEGDWSNAAFYFVGGLINGKTEVANLNPLSDQGDKRIVEVLKDMGGKIETGENSVTAEKSDLNKVEVNVDDIPDAVPALSIAAAFAKGTSVFKNIARLRMKESDRVKAIIAMLNAIGIESYEQDNSLFVVGGTPKYGEIDSFKDHRIAMAGAVALSVTGGTIINADAVNKSYPDFFEDFKAIGGKVNV